jgi:hypothetical protein
MPLRLSDSELDAILAAARPIDVRDRDAFLKSVADALKGCGELGPGTVARFCRELQREHFSPPALDRSAGLPRWARNCGGI